MVSATMQLVPYRLILALLQRTTVNFILSFDQDYRTYEMVPEILGQGTEVVYHLPEPRIARLGCPL